MKNTILIKMVLCGLVFANVDNNSNRPNFLIRNWGLGAVVRIASIPYATLADRL